MKSPFKFLDAFTLEDKHVFFGRDKEVEELYEMVFKSPLFLVYGLSGTGKTSLIQCGLAGRFDGPDWFPFFIRRQENINLSIDAALAKVIREPGLNSLTEKVSFLASEYFRPVFLIFDQFEELFILGSQQEQKEFLDRISNLLEAELPCRIIFIIREEYIGQLYGFEKNIPSIFDFRLRIEPMSNKTVKEVMNSSFDTFDISVEPPEEERIDQMIDNISGEKSGIQLPYLQVYLDLLYRNSFARQYGATVDEFRPVSFTKTGINQLGKIEDVLEKFLGEQVAAIQQMVQKTDALIPSDYVQNLLDTFVTEEGTKRPVYFTREGDFIHLNEGLVELLPLASQETLSEGIIELEKRRIVRFRDDNTIELAHDSLAHLIDQKRTDEQRQRNEILRSIKYNFAEYEKTKEFLSEKQLLLYEEHIRFLNLNPELMAFIEGSREHVKNQKEEKRLQQQREIEIEQERKASARRKVLLWIIGVLAALTTFASIVAYSQRNEAISARESLAESTRERMIETAKLFKAQGQYDEALKGLKEANVFAELNAIKRDAGEVGLYRNWLDIKSLMEKGDDYLNRKDATDTIKVYALQKYKEAYEIENDSIIAVKVQKTEEIISKSFDLWLYRAERFSQNPRCIHACEALLFAEKLNTTQNPKVNELKTALNRRCDCN